MSTVKDKIEHLNNYLIERYHLTLKEVLNKDIDDKDEQILNEISELFFLDKTILKDDSLDLPHDDHLKVDELVIRLKQGDYVNNIEKSKNKNVIKRNYKLLDKRLRKKAILSLGLTSIPFLFIIIYSLVASISNVSTTFSNYKNGDHLSKEQQKIKDELLNNDQTSTNYHADVKVGVTLEKISNISTANSSYTTTLSTTFDYNQKDYFMMYYYKAKSEVFNQDNFYTDEDFLADNFCFNQDGTDALKYSDNIPDIFQFNFSENTHMSSTNWPLSVSSFYQKVVSAYPGEKTSNVYADKNDEFRIGNGHISSDTLEYQDKGTPYFDEATNSYRYTQRLHFEATINKIFDSPRYPLDSAQFKIYIQPTRTTNYVRYIVDTEASGYSTYFTISDSYRLIKENNGIKNFNIKLNYYQEIDTDHSSITFGKTITKTQVEVIARANKHGVNVYLNSFLNIIAVALWLILAFYNQSFNKDDSIGMIGTGFFSAISAILLGLSLVGSSNTFSLLTLINIFTLIMVLTMGYEVITARRYAKLENASMIAYSTFKMRVLFYFLVFCSVIIYLLVPAISYIWLF